MDTTLPQKFPLILDRNLAKANCIGNRVCTSCDIVVLDKNIKGTDHKFWSKIAIFFFAEKASSGMWEISPKILGGYEY